MAKISRLVKILVWVALGVVVAMVLGWWLARLLREEEDTEEAVWTPPQRSADINIPLPPQELDEAPDLAVREAALDEVVEPGQPDDFTRIAGIGPKYAEGLVTCGITRYQQLIEQDPELLAEQLRALGLRVIGDRIVQDDWIGQARRLLTEG